MSYSVLLVLPEIIYSPAAWGAFLTGLGSVAAVLVSLRKQKAKSDDICDKRISDLTKAFKAGTEFERRQQRRQAG